MKRYLFTFRYHKRFDIQDEKQDREYRQLIKKVIAQIKEGDVALLNFEETHMERQDNHCDQTEAVTEPHTIIEIRIPAYIEDHIDDTDGGEDAYFYALGALEAENNEALYDYLYSCGDEPNVKDVIGIWVVYHNSEMEYDSYDEIEQQLRDLDH